MSPWVILWVLFAARTAMGFQFQSVAAVSPILIQALGIDLALLGLLIGVWMLPGVVVAIPGGMLGRRFGDKQVVLAGLALMVVGTLVTAYAQSYGMALTGRVVSGAGAVMLNVLLAKMVADWFQGAEVQTAMALLVISWPLGIGLALAVLGPLAAAVSWAFAMQIAAFTCLAALILVALVYRSPPHLGADATASLWRLHRRDFLLAFVSGLIWTFYNVAYIVAVSFTPVLLAAKGIEVSRAAIVTSFATWGVMLAVPAAGYLADRSGRGPEIMLAGLLAMALIMPFMLAVETPLAALALFGLVAGLPGGIIAAMPARTLSPQGRHIGLGLFFTLYYVGMASLPGVAGWLREVSRVDAAPLVFAAGLLVAAAGLGLVFRFLETR